MNGSVAQNENDWPQKPFALKYTFPSITGSHEREEVKLNLA